MKTQVLSPFGFEVVATAPGDPLAGLSPGDLHAQAAEHRLLVLRGFAAPSDDEMMAFCGRLGTILEWEFGSVNELQARPDAKNYLYTNREVPFHWDGAFAGKVPHYIFFHCRVAPPPDSGGETTFTDTPRLLQRISAAERQCWEQVLITYSTDKVVHYGGSFTAALLSRHPISGETVLRFAEPVDDLNPVRLAIEGIPRAEQPALLHRMHELLNDPALCHVHSWRTGDVVLADNHALLHGRRAFSQPAARHLRRVNIL
jgi:alpha-ketoglutarate-dependent taurine dioxygenase